MYETPKLLRYGNFRDLTQAGWNNADDHLFFRSIAGCNLGGCPQDPGTGGTTGGGARS
jgi:hypothetical protein